METVDATPKFDLQPNEKFACIILKNPGFHGSGFQTQQPQHLGDGCWLSRRPPFPLTQGLNQSWRDDLGKIVCNAIQQSTFVLTAKASSSQTDIRNDEDEILNRHVNYLLWGFAITAGVPCMDQFGSYFLAGFSTTPKVKISTPDVKVVRDFGTLARFIPTRGSMPPLVRPADSADAMHFVQRLKATDLQRRQNNLSYYRLANGLGALLDAMREERMLAKHHQYVRAIESFLPPSVFGMDDFSKFAGRLLQTDNRNKEVLKQIYDMRSAAEHHRPFDSGKPMTGVANAEAVAERLTRQAEAFARELFRRFLCADRDFLKHFENDQALESLWSDDHGCKLTDAWGNPLFNIHAIT